MIKREQPKEQSRWWRLAPLLLFGLALAPRLFRLTSQSLWLDEGGTWETITTHSWGSLLADLWSARAGYPLYHLLMKGWVLLSGDDVWALRLPSALAGALVVPLTYALGRRLGGGWVGLIAAVLLLVHPFALWISQDAKAYSLLMALVVWSLIALVDLLQAAEIRLRTWLGWLALLAALLMLHRLALLLVIGQVALVGWYGPLRGRLRRIAQLAPLALLLGLALGLTFGLRQDSNAPPVGTAINPATALWELLGFFTLDRTPAALRWLGGLALVIAAGGGVKLYQRRRHGAALAGRLLLTCGVLPLGLYLAALALGAPLFEPRYISFLLPLWALALAFGVAAPTEIGLAQRRRWLLGAGLAALLVGLQLAALLSKPYGLWSGAVVKEDYRGAVSELARRVTPGDVVIVHPAYIGALYRYYARRVTPDPLPSAQAFGRAGAVGYDQKEFDNDYSALLAGKRRGWLLLAPLNAQTIDPPNPQYPQDDMGRVGINFLTADLNEKWRCLDEPYRVFNGLRLLCQSFPAPLQPNSLEMHGAWPIPASATATFGDGLDLLGYEFAPWRADGTAQPGGTLPIRLSWRTRAPLPADYRMFVHLVPALGARVAAQLDTAPLSGGLPTSRWPLDRPLHDEVAVPLPVDMAAGRYLVVLGWYDPAVAGVDAQRLPVSAHSGPAEGTIIELGTIEVTQ
ncbi:MAG: glycosyltransferase family 39 protein [Herpetosiphonaceae bacterium]|nr:glycosyltransferase family 39 protein [Herpetosiphonaceae bacterium]